ncbi:MAG TPA: hypothetical protein VGI72_05460 [Gaiellales bacterium]|jgi:hypothetical protein
MRTHTHKKVAETLGERLDLLDDEVMHYGRAIETAIAARAAGCYVPSLHDAGADIARGAGRLADGAAKGPESRDHDRARALRKVAGHLHAIDLALDDRDVGHEPLDVVARALAAALAVFARPSIAGLTRLQDRVDLLLDHVEQHPGLRRMAPHLMGIGTAAEFVWANHPHLRPDRAIR